MAEPTCCSGDSGVTFLSSSKGMCRICRKLVDVRYVASDLGVFLERRCPEHGLSWALVADSLAWYLDAMRSQVAARPPEVTTPRGGRQCPEACGPCSFHGQRCQLPVISVTNACNLRCPICFTYNREDKSYFMSREEFARHMDYIVATAGSVDLVNITGGEPTLHPDLDALVREARRPGVGRVTVNTNGLTIAEDPEVAARLADLGAYVILSLDSLDPETCRRIHGRDISQLKRKALEQLERHGVQTTLLMVLIGGVNESSLAPVVEMAVELDFVRSLTIQTMAYTGQGGGSFLPRLHLPVDRAERLVAEASGGRITQDDFVPLPTAHPLCYGVTYLIVDDEGRPFPIVQALGRETMARHLSEGYLLHPTEDFGDDLRAAIDRIWAEGGNEPLLRAIKSLLSRLYPKEGPPPSIAERQKLAEQRVKTIYIHSHMDEDTWEMGRAMRCPDQVPVEASNLIGACNYNLFYRMRDERFWVEP